MPSIPFSEVVGSLDHLVGVYELSKLFNRVHAHTLESTPTCSNLDAIVTVLDAVRDAHFGTWESKDKTVFALSPVSLSALANEIYEYAENYNLIDNVATLEELTTGEETRKEVFHGLSAHVVEGALRLLVDQGKALLIAGSSLSELGIKFLRK